MSFKMTNNFVFYNAKPTRWQAVLKLKTVSKIILFVVSRLVVGPPCLPRFSGRSRGQLNDIGNASTKFEVYFHCFNTVLLTRIWWHTSVIKVQGSEILMQGIKELLRRWMLHNPAAKCWHIVSSNQLMTQFPLSAVKAGCDFEMLFSRNSAMERATRQS